MSSAHELSARLADLLRNERTAMAEFLVALAHFDRKRLWVDLDRESLFSFLTRDLGLSKSAAFFRKTAAELIQQYPEVVEPLRDGRLCLSTVAELAKVITRENVPDVLPRFYSRSKREAKEVTAQLLPAEAPPLRDVVTLVEAPVAAVASAVSQPTPPTLGELPLSRGSPANHAHANARVPDVAPVPSTAQSPVFEIEPLTAELRRLHITVSKRLLEKLDAARDALSHSHPGASRDEIIEAGLDLLLERAAKRRGLVKNPRKQAPRQRSAPASPTPAAAKARARYVPAAVRREIWKRDQGMCRWPTHDGGICGSTCRVEIDHAAKPFAKGGRILKPEDGRLLCAFHQDVSARQVYGDEHMNNYTKPKGPTCSEPIAGYGATRIAPDSCEHAAFAGEPDDAAPVDAPGLGSHAKGFMSSWLPESSRAARSPPSPEAPRE